MGLDKTGVVAAGGIPVSGGQRLAGDYPLQSDLGAGVLDAEACQSEPQSARRMMRAAEQWHQLSPAGGGAGHVLHRVGGFEQGEEGCIHGELCRFDAGPWHLASHGWALTWMAARVFDEN